MTALRETIHSPPEFGSRTFAKCADQLPRAGFCSQSCYSGQSGKLRKPLDLAHLVLSAM